MSRQFYNIYAPSDINDPKTKQYLIYLSQELNRALTYLTVSAGGIPPIPHARVHSLVSVADHSDIATYINQPLLTTSNVTHGIITGTSFVIGANTLDTNEWAFLDGQDQSVKTTSEVSFQPELAATGKGHFVIHNHAAEIGWYHYAIGTTVHGGSLILMGDDSLQLVTGAGLSLNQGFTITTSLTTLSTPLHIDGALDMDTHLINNVVNPVSPQDAATKAYVDLAVSSLSLTEFFSGTASDIGGIYYVMHDTPAAAGTVVSAGITSATTTNIFNFATLVAHPHLDRLVAGVYDIHAHLLKTGNRTITVYAKLFKYSAGGVETDLTLQSATSAALTASDTFYDIYLTIATEVTLLTTDRLVLKWYAVSDGGAGGNSTTVTMTVGGTADPHFSIKIEPTELSSIFVPYTGAENDVDLGAKNFLTTGTLGAGAITGTGLTINTFTTAGILHNAITTGIISSSLIVNADIDSSANIVVTKLYSSATSRIFGRISAGAGAGEELTAANVKTILALAQADISGLTTADGPTFDHLHITNTVNAAALTITAGNQIGWVGGACYFSSNGSNVITASVPIQGLVEGYCRSTLVASGTAWLYSKVSGDVQNRFEVDNIGHTYWRPANGTGEGTNCELYRYWNGVTTYMYFIADNYIFTSGGGNITGIAKLTSGVLSGITDNSANWDTAYTHSQDNTQAHSDYLLNDQSDSMNGTLTTTGLTVNGATVLNEGGADVDTRIEGDTDANAFFLDASSNNICLGSNDPSSAVGFVKVLELVGVNGALVFRPSGADGFAIETKGNYPTRFWNNGVEVMRTLGTGLVINEDGADIDTRIEGDTDTNALVVNAGSNNIGLGTDNPASAIGFSKVLELAGVNGAIVFQPSGADGFAIETKGDYPTRFFNNGVEAFRTTDNEFTINEGSADLDTRIEGNTDANLFFVDAGTDRVGIGISTPENKFHVYNGHMELQKGYQLTWGNNATVIGIDVTDTPAHYNTANNVMTFKSYDGVFVFRDYSSSVNLFVITDDGYVTPSTGYKSSDGSAGADLSITFYAASSSGGTVNVLNTVTVKDGLITAWTQA